MPRAAKPARLWLKPADEKTASVWVIKDGKARVSTGCAPGDVAEAERALKRHVAAKHDPRAARDATTLDETAVADVLTLYLREVVLASSNPKRAEARIGRLAAWWGDKWLSDVNDRTCQAYVEHRNAADRDAKSRPRKAGGHTVSRMAQKPRSGGGARRDLEDLRAAIGYHAEAKLHIGSVAVKLPRRGKARTKYLTRDEVAAMLWYCWRHRRTQSPPRGPDAGKRVQARDFHDMRHLARFILMGVYTGSRSGPILRASIMRGDGRAYLDLKRGVYHRLPEDFDEAANKKSPTSRLPRGLLAHLRRWQAKGVIAEYVVEWDGKPISSVKTAWARMRDEAITGGLVGNPVPHTLRHTCVTWLKQMGVSSFDVGNYVGMSEQMVETVYGHNDPNYQSRAIDALSPAHRRRLEGFRGPDRIRTDNPPNTTPDVAELLRKIEELQRLIVEERRS